MSRLRADIAAAMSRMRVTFGTRTAINNLHESLEPDETVVAMVACLYGAGDGVLVLTDQRILAVRDDYSRFRLKALDLAEAKSLDYAPKVHDGLAVFTDSGRVAVRKMDRDDADAFVDALQSRQPGLVLAASRPAGSSAPDGHAPSVTDRPAADGVTLAHAGGPVAVDNGPASGSHPRPPTATTGQADREVLLGVLADLHAKGLLTSDELAAKTAQVSSQPEAG